MGENNNICCFTCLFQQQQIVVIRRIVRALALADSDFTFRPLRVDWYKRQK